jgi:ABC-type sugar transport system ATPase subunit
MGKIIKGNSTDSEFILGIRPEDIMVEKRPTSRNSIKSEVYVTEPLGSEVIIDLKVGEEIIKVKTINELDLKIGDFVWIKFDESKMHIFDKKTEKAIL